MQDRWRLSCTKVVSRLEPLALPRFLLPVWPVFSVGDLHVSCPAGFLALGGPCHDFTEK